MPYKDPVKARESNRLWTRNKRRTNPEFAEKCRETNRKWHRDNRAKRNAQRKKNRDKVVVWERNARMKDLERAREKTRRGRRNRIARRDASAPRSKPDNCEHCGKPCKVFWDHDHKTNLFRSWACLKCNSTMGWAEDNPALLRKLADFLDVYNANKLKLVA